MNTTQHSVGSFEERLLAELKDVVAANAAGPVPAHPAAGADPTTHARRRTALRSALALGLTSAAAAAALAVATLVPGTGTSPRAGGPAVGSARSVLLAAAVRAESAPTTSGTYWHVRSMSTKTLPWTFGHGANRYTLEQLSVHEEWAKRNGQAWSGSRTWVRPKTPADEAAWRRDGAPSKWCVGETDSPSPEPICVHTAPGTASLEKNPFPFEVNEGHQNLTFAQLQRLLPKDPAALRAWLVADNRRNLAPSVSATVVNQNVIQELANLIAYLPVPPAVRAAAYRVLAGMPRVTSIGPTRDELGRAGVGIKIDLGSGTMVGPDSRASRVTGRFTIKLIIDPDTSQVLASEMRIGNRSVSGGVFLEVGWTNEKPHTPALP
jgi:hypothetical protein